MTQPGESTRRATSPLTNSSSQLVAGHLPRSGLKPLFSPKAHGGAPFTSRRAALPAGARGLATAE